MTSMTKPKATAGMKAARQVVDNDTLAAMVHARGVSPVRAITAFSWIAAWGATYDALGREPRNVEEVCAVLKLNRRTAFNWQAKFREIFPEYQSPATLWQLVHDQVHSTDPVVASLELGAAVL
jgi:hypothetical protein